MKIDPVRARNDWSPLIRPFNKDEPSICKTMRTNIEILPTKPRLARVVNLGARQTSRIAGYSRSPSKCKHAGLQEEGVLLRGAISWVPSQRQVGDD